MPNWCENQALFTHEDPEMIKRLVKGYNEGKLFNEFIPCPENLLREVDFSDENYNEKTAAITEENLQKHGYSSWYDWSIEHWGTKWDANSIGDKMEIYPDNSNAIHLVFDTAWSPPIEFYEHMTNEFKFDIHASYFEPGMCFVGEYDSEDGNESWEFDKNNLDEVPEHLRETYNIDSMFEEYDEDADFIEPIFENDEEGDDSAESDDGR